MSEVPDLVPARMVNEFVYCPRLFYLEWAQAQFVGNADTAEGKWQHRAVDKEKGRVHSPDDVENQRRSHSVKLSSQRLGLIAVIDTLEADDGSVIPVDTKKGSPPPHGPAWLPEQIQICVQGLLLRDNGYRCDRGEIFFVKTRERRVVEFDDALIERTLRAVGELRTVAAHDLAPPPLIDSPKCPRCSLVGVCLPDEINALADRVDLTPRRLTPRDSAARPLYVTEQGAYVGVRGGRVVVTKKRDTIGEARLIDVSQVNITGNAQVSSQALRVFFRNEIPVLWFSYGGWFSGIAHGLPNKNVELRRRQSGIAFQAGLPAARQLVHGKIRNQRKMLMRNATPKPAPEIASLNQIAQNALLADTAESLLGFEGTAARIYFSKFSTMLRIDFGFDFTTRNRRPPLDKTNCLLSFVYGLLVKDLTAIVFGVGFDPYLGVYHKPRFGRPAMALDLAEEFRPLVGDSVVISLINNGEVKPSDFVVRHVGVSLTGDGRKKVLAAYERRLDIEVTHPTFGYKITYRRVLEVQARIMAAYMMREVPEYIPFVTR